MNAVRWKSGYRLGLLLLLLLGAALCGPAVNALGTAGKPAPAATLAEADRLYGEKSYAAALEGYEALLQAGRVPEARRDEVQYRIAVSLGKSGKWDRALEYGLDFVKARQKTVWEPRGLYWLGRLYLGVPHEGYRRPEGTRPKVYRGGDVPKVESAEKPEQVSLWEQDQRNALDALEAARVFYPAYRATSDVREEEIQLNFDLARVLQSDHRQMLWMQGLKWPPPTDKSWAIDPATAYSPDWPQPKKLRYLFAQIVERSGFRVQGADLVPNAQRPAPNAHNAALALFAEATWLNGYHNIMRNAAVRWENNKRIPIPYPYQDVRAEAVLRRLVREFPDDPVRDQAQYTIGMFLSGQGQNAAAAEEYRRLIRERPNSKWVENARAFLDGITRRELSVAVNGTILPGKPVKAGVSYRNVRTLHFELFRVDPEAVLARAEVLNDPQVGFTNFPQNFGKLERAGRFYGPLVARWDRQTKDKGDYQAQSEEVPLPVKEPGAYAVEVSAPGVRAATLLLVTDLAVVQKLERDQGLFFVTNAVTGEPVPDAELVVKHWWNENGTMRSASARGKTNADGLHSATFQRGPGRGGFSVAAFARKGVRCAVTNQTGSWWGGDNPDILRVYSITDRPVYRPAQTVHYRQLVMRRQKGETKPAANQHVQVVVRNPRGTAIHTYSESADAFGSVSGSLSLPADAPLGEYRVEVTVPNVTAQGAPGLQYSGGNRFRVEEYKKPEFEVTVLPAAERVKLGEPTAARIHAEYYFGGPVPNAKVTYRVHRTPWAQRHRFPRPFDFIYGYNDRGDYHTYYRNGPVVKQGETRTDAKGEAEISFPTDGTGNQDSTFTIEADVQDASRRVISGTGSVKATRHDVAAFLDFPRGYATKGDQVDVEIITLNPSDQPVSVSGAAKVYRYPQTPEAKEALVHEEPLKTDSRGRAYLKWKNGEAGRFRVAFETRDTSGQPVSGSTDVWVQGPELEKGRFLFRDVMLRVREPYYEEGQTASVLLVTPAPGCTVLFTREVNNEIAQKQVIRVPGRSLELKLPLARADVPNVYLQAIMVRDDTLFQATQELFVPPVRQFAKVTVKADRERYEPGQKARFHLEARDWQGRPLRTQLSVAVTDASLSYIQKDYAPDIQAYYYGDRRSQSVPQSASTGVQFQPAQEDDQPRKEYKVHEWLLPEGMGMLADWPGDRAGYTRYWGMDYGRMAGMGGGGFGGFGARQMAQSARVAGLGGPAGPPGPPGAPVMAPAEFDTLAARKPKGDSAERGNLSDKQATGEGGQEEVRTNFADTAFWTPAVVTDAQGEATVEVTWPDNLTQWRAYGVGTTTEAQVGSAETRVRTKKDLLVRLQAPRFFVERDLIVLSANVQNALPADAAVRVRLQLGGDTAEVLAAGDPAGAGLFPASVRPAAEETSVQVPKDGEKRIDWLVRIRREGQLRVRMSVEASGASDATQATFPVLVHGVERQTALSGVLRGERKESTELGIELPEARKPGSSELVVQLNPSMGAVMLDALPYLLDYPYGCIEQTVSRFVPAVVVRKTLADLGFDLADLQRRARLLEEKEREGDRARPGGKTVENSPYSYPKGRPGTLRTSDLSRQTHRWGSPVFDSQEMDNILQTGLGRITQMQNGDGGWGWWPGNSSDPYMTAYTLYALLTGRESGMRIDPQMIDRGLNYLSGRYLTDDNFHRMAFEARTLAMDPRYRGRIRALTAGRLWENRERLSAYSKALLATALHQLGEKEKAETLLRNIETTAKIDEANGTASWDDSDRSWWSWYNNRVETNAAVLQAYVAVRPGDRLPPFLVKWLVNNRRGGSWRSTKETAMAVYALADYVRASKELNPEYTFTVDLGGKVQRTYTVTRENALFFDNSFVVPDELLETGRQALTIRKDGPGALYYTAYTRYFSLEEPIRETGNEIFVGRRYFRLLPGTAEGAVAPKPLDVNRPNPFLVHRYELLDAGGEWTMPGRTEGGPRYRREEVRPGDTVASGDLLEVELYLEAKNDYEYLVFEDLKPAGCEPVEVRSGGNAGQGAYSYMELRDQKVAFFLGYLAQGKSTLSYRLRAEIPGRFHVLPTNGYAMYAPDIRALSNEMTLGVRDSGD